MQKNKKTLTTKKFKATCLNWRKLKSGDYVLTLDTSKKSLQYLKKAAMLDDSITLQDVKNQIRTGREKFSDLLLGAFTLKALLNFTEEK